MNDPILITLAVVALVAVFFVGYFIGCMRGYARKCRDLGVVTIEHWGQATPRPKVGVGVASRRGSQSVYTYDATEQGEACATLYGHGVAHILGVPLIDKREASCDANDSA
jgi:hypothetical protein